MPAIQIQEAILTEEQLGKIFDLSAASITKLIKRGLPCTVLPGTVPRRVFLMSSVIEFLKAQEQGDSQ